MFLSDLEVIHLIINFLITVLDSERVREKEENRMGVCFSQDMKHRPYEVIVVKIIVTYDFLD